MPPAISTQIIGNIGLFHVCHELSKRGLNVVPTSRNTRAVDVIVARDNFSKHATIQVKTTTIDMGITLGRKEKYPTIDDLVENKTGLADFWIYVRISSDNIYATKYVFVWRGDDKQLIREMPNDYWYEPMNKSKKIDDDVKKKWEDQRNEGGWKLITEHLKP